MLQINVLLLWVRNHLVQNLSLSLSTPSRVGRSRNRLPLIITQRDVCRDQQMRVALLNTRRWRCHLQSSAQAVSVKRTKYVSVRHHSSYFIVVNVQQLLIQCMLQCLLFVVICQQRKVKPRLKLTVEKAFERLYIKLMSRHCSIVVYCRPIGLILHSILCL